MIIVEKDPKSYVSEAYRTLRTNIKYSSLDEKIQTILVTSSSPSEGKSTVVSNLAMTLAQEGNSVLIIDCDLRKPSIHKKFRISNLKGLSNYLVEEENFDKTIEEYADGLFIMTSGVIPPNPSEMLSSKKLQNFINKCKVQFDYIILDTPPILAVTDAQILSTIVDGVVLVVASGQTDKDAVIKAKELLSKVNANIIGTVLTKVPQNKGRNYGYYYYYYGEDDKQVKKKKERKKSR